MTTTDTVKENAQFELTSVPQASPGWSLAFSLFSSPILFPHESQSSLHQVHMYSNTSMILHNLKSKFQTLEFTVAHKVFLQLYLVYFLGSFSCSYNFIPKTQAILNCFKQHKQIGIFLTSRSLHMLFSLCTHMQSSHCNPYLLQDQQNLCGLISHGPYFLLEFPFFGEVFP